MGEVQSDEVPQCKKAVCHCVSCSHELRTSCITRLISCKDISLLRRREECKCCTPTHLIDTLHCLFLGQVAAKNQTKNPPPTPFMFHVPVSLPLTLTDSPLQSLHVLTVHFMSLTFLYLYLLVVLDGFDTHPSACVTSDLAAAALCARRQHPGASRSHL